MACRGAIVLWFALMLSTFAVASTPINDISFERRVWTAVDGAPAGAWRIAQSEDGLLWFAPPNGLYRYDGERFQRVSQVYGHALRSYNISDVAAVADGIVVTYQFGGVSIFKHSEEQHYGIADGLPPGALGSPSVGPDGKLYLGTSRGLAVREGQAWHLVQDLALTAGRVTGISVDDAGTIWVTVAGKLYGRPKENGHFSYVTDIAVEDRPEVVFGKLMVISRDNKLVKVEFGKNQTVVFDGIFSVYDGIYQGPLSTTWAWLSNGKGLVLLRQGEDGRYEMSRSFEDGRPDKSVVQCTLLDREGNLWLSTLNGVERYRAQRIHEVAMPKTTFNYYVQQGLGDSLVATGQAVQGVLRLTDSGYANLWDLAEVTALWRQNADSVWGGTRTSLFHVTHDGIAKWPLPEETLPLGTVQSVTVDKAGTVWVSILRSGLYRFMDGRWSHVDTSAMGADPVPIILYTAASGRVWSGYTNGRIAELVDGKIQSVTGAEPLGTGHVLSLIEIDGRLLAGGELGMASITPHGHRPFLPEQITAFRGVSGLALDKQGDLWAHGADGVYHIRRGELEQYWADPTHTLKWEVFNLTDGVRGNAAQIRPLPSLVVANDGKVYYATNNQVGWIDPLNVRRNPVAPHVMIQNVRVGSQEFQPDGTVRLAAGTTAAEIRFAATSLSVPEKVKLKFKLNGVDREWQDVLGERVARYTNLEPGTYHFQVIAANEDGVWNQEGAALQLEILPEFWQTSWFRLLMLMLLMAAMAAIYRWRIATASARATERAAARMEERERIARGLHDNLLQGVHALILRCSTLLKRLPKGSQEQHFLENVLDQAEQLVANTRDEVMGLRNRKPSVAILAETRAELGAMADAATGRLKVSVSDSMEQVRPAVLHELCHVLKEGVTNAVRHSEATEITATLTIADGLIVGAVLDNGVGIPPERAEHGVPGHWGIMGMRERIAKLGGALTIASAGERGTALRFTLPLSSAA